MSLLNDSAEENVSSLSLNSGGELLSDLAYRECTSFSGNHSMPSRSQKWQSLSNSSIRHDMLSDSSASVLDNSSTLLCDNNDSSFHLCSPTLTSNPYFCISNHSLYNELPPKTARFPSFSHPNRSNASLLGSPLNTGACMSPLQRSPNAVNDREILDCIQWLSDVLAFNHNTMSLSDLIVYVRDSSLAWYNFIVQRFYSVRQFLSLYSSHFRLFQSGGIEMVSLVRDTEKPLFMSEEDMQKPSFASAIQYSCQLLIQAPNHTLKSVELANSIRDHLGADCLSVIRKEYNGLLNFYEMIPRYFSVSRVPKNDSVTLITTNIPKFSPNVLLPCLQNTCRCLHVGNLSAHMNEDSLRKIFGSYGSIEDVHIVNQGDRRYAFVYFTSIEGAINARDHLTQQPKWKGNIAFAKREKKDHTKPSASLLLGNVDLKAVSMAQLRCILSKFGTLVKMTAREDKDSVLVFYTDNQSVEKAFHGMKGKTINGRMITVEMNGGAFKSENRNGKNPAVSMVIVRVFHDVMKSTESGVMVPLPVVVSRMKNDLTILSLFESGECNDTILVSLLCQLDLGYVVVEDSGDISFWNVGRSGSFGSAAASLAQLRRVLLCSSRVLLWPKDKLRDAPILNCLVGLARVGVSYAVAAKRVAEDVLQSSVPMAVTTVEAFVAAYSAVFDVADGVIHLRR